MARDGEGRLKSVGAIWKPKPGGKSKGSGSCTIKGFTQRFVILTNSYKKAGSKQPDYVMMSSEGPEKEAPRASRQEANQGQDDDDIAF